MSRVFNFSAGPATLPQTVLEQIQEEFLDYQGQGMSIIEMSHRSMSYGMINSEAEARFKGLLGLDEGYRVLFMQGGASSQFALVPMHFLPDDRGADYVITGTWSEKALVEAQRLGEARVAASGQAGGYRQIPPAGTLEVAADAAYVHITSNNTIYGTQWHRMPESGDRRLVADMSSDILCRPFDGGRFDLIYAGAQKNLGPAGVTVVILRTDWLEEARTNLPTMFDYRTHVQKDSLYNTPPVFPIYALNLVLCWIDEQGGLEAVGAANMAKAELIYEQIDASGGFYRGRAAPDSRSLMNVTFNLPTPDLEKAFVQGAAAAGMVGLKGYRTLGGVRASIYNAMPRAGCEALAGYMAEFARSRG